MGPIKRRRKRAKGERGSVLVEAAFITPIFMMLLFGVIEWGYGFMDRLTVANSSLAGARVASSEGSNSLADYNILQAIAKASSVMKSGQIQVIVVYKATAPGGSTTSVPAACLTSSQSGSCNRYTGANFASAQTLFGCAAGDLDLSWCPGTRKSAAAGTNGPPDYIGVYVQGVHTNATGFFGTTYTFRGDTIIRIEPTTSS
ncbi:MAG: hypothetical protein QOF97_894 [Acidimicrobiaceae bacterium]|jgi:Flp pilus assembly protein TadG